MAWNIGLLSNTANVTPDVARALVAQFPNIPVIDLVLDGPDNPLARWRATTPASSGVIV